MEADLALTLFLVKGVEGQCVQTVGQAALSCTCKEPRQINILAGEQEDKTRVRALNGSEGK